MNQQNETDLSGDKTQFHILLSISTNI
jgi:hypothetical protein